MVILHILDVQKAAGNGVAVAVKNYATYEKEKNDVAIYCLNDKIESAKLKVFNISDYASITNLPSPFNKPDIVIFNEIYKKKYINLYKYCKANGIKYVIIPHGSLNAGAQKNKKLKKKIANLLLFNKFICNATAIQFLNETEMSTSKFKYQKGIVHGNGVEIPKYKNESKNNDLVFIGRYDVKVKGLDIIAEICHNNAEWFRDNNVKIMLYGRTSKNGLEELEEIVREKNVSDIMVINGPIYGNEKEKVLSECYGFLQTSRHEGQPMGILEALSVGIPCIVTYGTTFGEYVNDNNCGYGVNFDSKEIFEKIKKLYEDKANRNLLADNARKKSIKDFEWTKIIDKTCKEYKEIIRE